MIYQALIVASLFIAPPPHPDTPGLVARVEVETRADGRVSTNSFLFVRTPDRVERHDAERSMIWIRTTDGQIEKREISHRHQRVIEHMAGDLRAMGRVPNWSRLWHLFQPDYLTECRAKRTREKLSRPATQYRCDIGDTEYRVDWWNDLELPAQVIEKSEKRSSKLKIVEIFPFDDSPYELPNLQGYQWIDFSDLGDWDDHSKGEHHGHHH